MDERSKVDKYLCTVCGHRHSNGWYCKHSIDAKDATIAELRAEVERLKEILEANSVNPNQMVLNSDSRDAELTQLREDRRVLACEVDRSRSEMACRGILEMREGRWHVLRDDGDGSFWYPFQQADAVDASGALGRAT